MANPLSVITKPLSAITSRDWKSPNGANAIVKRDWVQLAASILRPKSIGMTTRPNQVNLSCS